jgi:hypothetical protein
LKVSTRQWATQLLHGRLTTCDLELVRALIGVGMLTRHQIQRLFFDHQTNLVANRLTNLHHYHVRAGQVEALLLGIGGETSAV